MLQGFLVALVSALIYLESRLVGQHMLDRPIIIGPVVGLIMGDPVTGLVVGGQLELVWMGLNGIGTTTPPNVVVGSASPRRSPSAPAPLMRPRLPWPCPSPSWPSSATSRPPS